MNPSSASLTRTRAGVDRVQQSGRRAAQRQQDWLVPLGRIGYAANGLVYLIVGVLAAQAAFGTGGDTTGTGGALGHIVEAPFGRLLLGIVAVGLAGYAIWRLLQALLDTEHKGDGAKGLLARAGFAITTVIYAGLALSAAGMALGTSGTPDQEGQTQDRTAWLMSQPFGPWLVAAVGLIVICVGGGQLVQAYRASFLDKLREDSMNDAERTLVELAGRVGYVARGIVFGLVGVFLVIAGVQARPDQARGLGGTLTTLAGEPFGPVLLALVAVGLIAYGAYMLVAARYRRMVLS
ncbi:MAG: DUF1206 domain-containing protein [Chloroflexi bacterium]|nr:DUF1206 domain-containing protein [Chloroflexota bacterium]